MNNARIAELMAEKQRITNEINKLKREMNNSVGVKITRYGTGKIILLVKADDERDFSQKQFRTIAGGWSLEDVLDRAGRVADRVKEFCELPTELIENMINNG